MASTVTRTACSVRVRGVVQGVGFRPFVYRLACANTLAGWVLNGGDGVEIHVEGTPDHLDAFLRDLRTHAPPAADIRAVHVDAAVPTGIAEFSIRFSQRQHHADGRHLARPGRLRSMPVGAVRSRRPPLRLSVHQLHRLRSALFDRRGGCPTIGPRRRWTDGRWTRPATASITTPGAGGSTPSRSPAPHAARAIGSSSRAAAPSSRCEPIGRTAAAASRRRDRRDQGTRRLPPGLRRAKRRRGRRRCGRGNTARRSRSR